MAASPANDAVETAAREERAAVIGAVARDVRDLQLAEDAFQDAVVAALKQWPVDGVPHRPAAWLTTVARRSALRAIQRGQKVVVDEAAVERLANAAAPDPSLAPAIPDARLELLFACCHPALSVDAQVALTLRTVGGLTTPEIARAFLVDEGALAQRLVRAQRKIRDSGIPFSVPSADLLPERMAGVLGVVYLIFNEGYASSTGPSRVRDELCDEAVDLARLVAVLAAGDPEALGLAALVLAHDARRAARIDADGHSIPLDEQDRSLYDRAKLEEAERLLDRAIRSLRPGRYQLQAAIACLHTAAPVADDTDWEQISKLYSALEAYVPSPMVALNRAAAVGMAEGSESGLVLLDELAAAESLQDHHLLHAARADLLRRSGRDREADAALLLAIELAPPDGTVRTDLESRRSPPG